MRITISRSDIMWSYFGNILRYGANLLLLPLILRQLPAEEVGLWYIFTAIGNLVMLMDFGFSPTLQRNIGYAWGGARRLVRNGLAEDLHQSAGADAVKTDAQGQTGDPPNAALLLQLLHLARRIYMGIALGALIVNIAGGTLYIRPLVAGMPQANSILCAWAVFTLGVFINLAAAYWMPLLTGVGRIRRAQQANVISQLVYLLAAGLGVLLGMGLLAVALAGVLGGAVLRIVSRRFFLQIREIHPAAAAATTAPASTASAATGVTAPASTASAAAGAAARGTKELWGILWHNSWKLGLVTLGSFLILQAGTLICSLALGLEITASYGLALQLFTSLGNFSAVLFRSSLPLFYEARLKQDWKRIRRVFPSTVLVSWTFYLAGGVTLVLAGAPLLKLLGSGTRLPPTGFLFFMLGYTFLEFNTGTLFATFIMTGNQVPFVGPALLSGIGVAVLTFVLVKTTRLGIWGVGLAQFLVQLVYNNWKWPHVVLKEMKMTLPGLVREGARSLAGMRSRGETGWGN